VERGSHNRVDWERSWRENFKSVERPGVGRVLDWRVPWTGQRILDRTGSLGLKMALDW